MASLGSSIVMAFGSGCQVQNDLSVYENGGWKPIKHPMLGRNGHTMVGYKDSVCIFGGRLNSTYREITNETILFHPQSNTYE